MSSSSWGRGPQAHPLEHDMSGGRRADTRKQMYLYILLPAAVMTCVDRSMHCSTAPVLLLHITLSSHTQTGRAHPMGSDQKKILLCYCILASRCQLV
jgi:hypothetical protein